MSDDEARAAPTNVAVMDAVRRRWSPRAFAPTPVEREKLLAVLEAGRWAPSRGNEQPWRFLLATSDAPEAHAAMVACLTRGNQWASAAPVLMVTLTSTVFERKGGVNDHARHDLGIALGQMGLQAVALGLRLHPMSGILPDRVRQTYVLPESVEPVGAVAIGYRGDPAGLPADLRAKESRERRRRDLRATVFQGVYGRPADVLEEG